LWLDENLAGLLLIEPRCLGKRVIKVSFYTQCIRSGLQPL
jgi:hypothetical protein